MNLHEAVQRGITRVRDPNWACPEDHFLLDLFPDPRNPGKMFSGPWLHLYSPLNERVNGRNPVDMLFNAVDWNEDGWVAYEPPPMEKSSEGTDG